MFNMEIFFKMVDGGAFDKAEQYLKDHKYTTRNGKITEYKKRLDKARKLNKGRSRSRNKHSFNIKYVPGGTICNHCGNYASEMDHIIPHVKRGTIPTKIIKNLCKKLKSENMSVSAFLSSDDFNLMFLCSDCNFKKRWRERNINWYVQKQVIDFYFNEKNRKPEDETEANIRKDFAKRIAATERAIRVATNKGEKTGVLYNRLKGQKSRMEKKIAAARKA